MHLTAMPLTGAARLSPLQAQHAAMLTPCVCTQVALHRVHESPLRPSRLELAAPRQLDQKRSDRQGQPTPALHTPGMWSGWWIRKQSSRRPSADGRSLRG